MSFVAGEFVMFRDRVLSDDLRNTSVVDWPASMLS
jgi:hypothetical protein